MWNTNDKMKSENSINRIKKSEKIYLSRKKVGILNNERRKVWEIIVSCICRDL